MGTRDYFGQIVSLQKSCNLSGESLLPVLVKSFRYRALGKRIFAHQKCTIQGLANISVGNRLEIGLAYRGFTHKSDQTYLNVQGILKFRSSYNIGRGCRFDIGPEASVVFGRGFVNANSLFVIMHHLEVGDDSVISWNCQFIDEDFHTIKQAGSVTHSDPGIRIGDHVWIGCNVTVLKGAVIPNGCVVAAGSVVTKPFAEENALLAGIPAKIIRKGVEWC